MADRKDLYPKSNEHSPHIETVAKTLLTLEYCILWVGLPLVKPNKKRSEYAKEYFHPLHDYVKCSLVSVPTSELELLLEHFQLDPAIHSEPQNELDALISLPLWEKLYFPVLSILVVSAITFCSIMPLTSSIQHTFYATVSASLGALIASMVMVMEPIRRHSFKNILLNELKRRKGVFGSGEKITIMKPSY